jgi:hypothetical protein
MSPPTLSYMALVEQTLDVQCPVLVKKRQTLTGIKVAECTEERSAEDCQKGDTLPTYAPDSCIIRDSIRSLRGTTTDNEKCCRRQTTGELVLHCTIQLLESICFENTATVESRARAPTFYSGPVTDEMRWLAGMAATLVAAVFGALHCLAWSSQFPSQYHQQLWRVCSIIIISVPISFPLASLFAVLYRHRGPSWLNSRPRPNTRLRIFHGVVLIVAIFTYFLARVTLVTQAIMLLKSLPPEVFQTVRWKTFIPHL